MTDLQVGLWVGGISALNWLTVAYYARRDRRLWRDYYARQIEELDRRDRVGVHARRVTVASVAAAPGTRVAIGMVWDDTLPAWVGPRTIKARGLDLVDGQGATLTIPAGADLLVHDLPEAEWRAADDQRESAYDLTVAPDEPFYILVEAKLPPPPPADPYRGMPAAIPLARVPDGLALANPWIRLGPDYAVATDPRAFDVEVVRRGGFRAWIVGVAIAVIIVATAAITGIAQDALALGVIILFGLIVTGDAIIGLPIPRRAPPEEARTWRAEVR